MLKLLRHVYFAILRCGYFAKLKFRNFAKILYFVAFQLRFLSNTHFFPLAMLFVPSSAVNRLKYNVKIREFNKGFNETFNKFGNLYFKFIAVSLI